MNWYLSKFGTSTSGVLFDIDKSGIFRNRRFASFIGTGIIGFYEYEDGNIYEVRVESLKSGLDNIGKVSKIGSGVCLRIMDKIKSGGIFNKFREDIGFSGSSFIGSYKDGEEYLVSVSKWDRSNYRDYFIDSKIKENQELKVNSGVVKKIR